MANAENRAGALLPISSRAAERAHAIELAKRVAGNMAFMQRILEATDSHPELVGKAMTVADKMWSAFQETLNGDRSVEHVRLMKIIVQINNSKADQRELSVEQRASRTVEQIAGILDRYYEDVNKHRDAVTALVEAWTDKPGRRTISQWKKMRELAIALGLKCGAPDHVQKQWQSWKKANANTVRTRKKETG